MFGASIFLAGLVAVGVPIAIHLLARQRTRVIDWGAMEFLKMSISSASSRRNRLRDLILLLLRTLAILFLVLTFAQPLASRLFYGGKGLETVFIWDISLSTSALDQSGKPQQETMREALIEEIQRLPNNSTVRILLAGSELRWLTPSPLMLSSNNRKALEQAVRDQPVERGGSQLASAILLAMADNRKNSDTQQRHLVLVQDFQRGAWQTEDTDRWDIIRRKLAQDPEMTLRLAAADTIIPGTGPQVAVVSLEAERDAVALNAPVRFRAGLRNTTEEEMRYVTVIWLVNGREVERSVGVKVSRDMELKLEQVLSFETEGSHQIECRIELTNDQLPADNSAFAVVSAHLPLPVLIVDDSLKTEQGQILPSEFLVASLGGTLSKKQSKQVGAGSLFNPQVIASKEIKESTLEGQVAVIIASATDLPENAAAELGRFVKNGGGLWLMMSTTNETPPEWHVTLLKELGMDSLAATTRRIAPNPETPFRLVATDPTGEFAERIVARGLDLFRTQLSVLHELEQPTILAEEKLLETPEGKPVLLSLAVGSGRLIIQMNDLTRGNSNLPVLQSFVPFVRETLRECMGGMLPMRNLNPGQSIKIPLISLAGHTDIPSVTPPESTARELSLLGGEYQTAQTLQPGIYQVTGLRDNADKPATQLFSVRRPVEESYLSVISPKEAQAYLQKGSGSTVTSTNSQSARWPLAVWFAVITALFFLAEAVLAHFLVGRRESSGRRIELKPVF